MKFSFNRGITAATFIVMFAIATNCAVAAPMFFTNQPAFQTAASGITLATENFDTTGPGGFPQVTPTSITVSATNTGPNGSFNGVLTAISGGTGNTAQFQTQNGGTSISFTFSTPINAFGIDIFDLGTTGATNLTLTTDNGAQLLFNNFTGGFANQQFAGVVDTNPFSTVTFTNTASGDFVGFDNLQFGAASTTVPEPSTFAIFGIFLAVGAGCWFYRRQRATAASVA